MLIFHVYNVDPGPAARIWGVCVKCIRNSNGNQNNDEIQKWNKLNDNLDQIKADIHQYSNSLQWLSQQSNQDLFEADFRENMNQNLNKLQQIIDTKKQKQLQIESEMETLDIFITAYGGTESDILNVCDKLNIKPWHYRDDSMVGPSVKKFLNDSEIMVECVKKYDTECAAIVEPCLARLQFLARCMWTKNKELFSDECVNYLKWNLIEFDYLYHLLIEKYGGGRGHRLGVKWHTLYHCYEWIEQWRWSPSWLDDQRVESFNIYVHKLLPIYSCFHGHVNLHKMMDKMWRNFVLG